MAWLDARVMGATDAICLSCHQSFRCWMKHTSCSMGIAVCCDCHELICAASHHTCKLHTNPFEPYRLQARNGCDAKNSKRE